MILVVVVVFVFALRTIRIPAHSQCFLLIVTKISSKPLEPPHRPLHFKSMAFFQNHDSVDFVVVDVAFDLYLNHFGCYKELLPELILYR